MVEGTITITGEMGLHARPAIRFVQQASEFPCDIEIAKGDKNANAKSISQVLALKIRKNDEVLIRVTGEMEEKALCVLKQWFETQE